MRRALAALGLAAVLAGCGSLGGSSTALRLSAAWTGSECYVSATNPGSSLVTVAYVTVGDYDSSGNQLETVHVPLSVSGIGPGQTVTATESRYVVDSRTVSCQALGWSASY